MLEHVLAAMFERIRHLPLILSVSLSLSVDTSDRLYDDIIRLLFLHAHREASALTIELPEESDQFRFLQAACLTNLKGSVGLMLSVGLILTKESIMQIPSCPLDLSSRSFIPLPRFIRSRRSPPLAPSLVLFPLRSV
jgi:hypothetical protein